MTMRYVRRLALATSVTASLVLTGCGVGGGGGDDGGKAQDAAKGKITGSISFQTWNLKAGFKGYFEDVVDTFEKKHPGTKVKWIDQPAEGYADKLSADAAGDTLPDVINLDRSTAAPLAKAKLLLDLDEADPGAGKDYLAGAWKSNDWKDAGGHYAYPWYLNTGPTLYNTGLFKKAGMNTKKLPTTYDELFDQAMEMAKKSKKQYAMIGQLPGTDVMAKYGIKVMNDAQTKYVFNSPEGVAFVKKYVELYKAGAIIPEALSQDYVNEGKNFQSGRLAYLPGSSYTVKELKKNAPSVYKNLAIQPQITNNAPGMYIQSVGVSAHTKNSATALAFARFVTDAENQLAFAKEADVFPSGSDGAKAEYFHADDGSDAAKVRVLSADQLDKAVEYTWPGTSEAQKTDLREQIALAVSGKKSVKKALDDAVAFANKQAQDGK
ncbi:extracellular solute-binding protein [Streptomyces endophyticus]|nr:extracellular solute-binding protein [Streptomyces endophyticus]